MLRSRASLFVETVKYDFSYDNTSRLLKASFTQNAGTLWNTSAGFDFTMAMGDGVNPQSAYDANGNIKGMTQYGRKATSSGIIDQLTYSYYSNSNKLGGVADAANDPSSTLGDFKEVAGTGSSDYFYDLNGNLMLDANKNIKDLITYNHLNLPEKIVITGKGNIQFWYDANGNKLRKKVTDNTATPAKITTTDYIGNFVFEGDILEFASHEEGRIRPITTAGAITDYAYDYFIKDHLGNVRAVLTDKSDASLYTATMETERAATETALFSNMDETRAAKPVGYPQDQTTQKNEFVAKLNAKDGGKKIGPSLVIKVMAGDTVQIGAKAFHKSIGPKNSKSATPEDMIASLLQVFSGMAGSQDASHAAARQAGAASPFGNLSSNDYQRLKEKDPDQNRQDKPKAYLNFALFDDQFNLVEDNSGVRQVKGEADELQTLAVDKMTIKKNGFLYVYTSNETPQDVFFDNVTLGVTTGPVVEEMHYYPFGLTMEGVSSNALVGTNYAKNRKGYNGIEHTTDLDFNQYDAFYRSLDPQLGRWWQIDSKPNYSESPYASMSNIPISMVDPLGDTTQYFAANGKHLYTSNDGLKNVVTVIPKANSVGFALIMKLLNSKYGAQFKDNDNFNAILRNAGISYSASDYFSIYDEHRNDVYTGNDMRSVDVKPLIKKYKIRLYNDNGQMNARGEDDKNGTPGLTILSQGDAQGTLHTHAEEGREFLGETVFLVNLELE